MNKQSFSKVFIDSSVDENIPTVAVSGKREESPELFVIPMKKPAMGITSGVRKAVNFSMDFLETAVVALSIFVVVYLFLVQPHEIKGSSMEPNFHNNEYILTDKISYKFKNPQRGEVVIFKAPKNPDVDYIKRVIGLPGEKIKIQNGGIYINGKKLNEPYLTDSTSLFPGQFMQEGVEITIPDEYYFVMGDNRQHSSDSREFGPVPANIFIGRAFLRYWPIQEFGLLPKASY